MSSHRRWRNRKTLEEGRWRPQGGSRRDLWQELMQFYIHEAWLLDDRKFHDWLDLFTDDVFYFMPRRRNVQRKDLAQELTEVGDLAWKR